MANFFVDVRVKLLVPLMAMLLVMTACGGGGNSSSAKPLPGGDFNKFFPKESGGFDVTFTQEKSGMAQAKLKKGGKEVATLTISDLINNSSAAGKFKSSTTKIGGYPSASSGSKGTTLLVGNRFQVQVRSKGSDFAEGDRKIWLEKFNLSGLAKLK